MKAEQRSGEYYLDNPNYTLESDDVEEHVLTVYFTYTEYEYANDVDNEEYELDGHTIDIADLYSTFGDKVTNEAIEIAIDRGVND